MTHLDLTAQVAEPPYDEADSFGLAASDGVGASQVRASRRVDRRLPALSSPSEAYRLQLSRLVPTRLALLVFKSARATPQFTELSARVPPKDYMNR